MTALLERDQLYTNLSLLERLAVVAATPEGSESPPIPSRLPGLDDEAAKFVAEDPRARGALATWFVVFKDTIELLRKFRSADLAQHDPEAATKPEYRHEVESALQASQLALEAAVQRINYLARRPG